MLSGNLLEIPVLGKLELESRGTPEILGGSPKKYFFMWSVFIILRDRPKEDVGNKNHRKLFFLWREVSTFALTKKQMCI